VDDAFSQSAPYKFENRITRPGGEVRFLDTLGEITFDESGMPLRVSGTVQDITERKLADESRRESEERFQILARATNEVIWDWNIVTNGVWWNEGIRTVFGYAANEVGDDLDWWLKGIHPDDAEPIGTSIHEFFDGDAQSWTGEYRYACSDGPYATVIDRGTGIRDNEGKPVRMIGSMRDITEIRSGEEKLRQTEGQLRQSQKLESIGLLAGGIAHDFNNMLTAINGYSELTLRRLKEDDPLRRNIEEIKRAGERSAALTYQLLAFSRQQILQPKVLSLNRVITDTGKMLERLIGEDIQLSTALSSKAGQVKVDPGQLTQIIMNLAVNARDAMPLGGKLTIETDNVTLNDEYALHHVSTIPGDYVMMSISDTGTGMDAETQGHIFEPFFTTKEVGKGTGLGLATVYGIVKQSGGNILVYSEEGVGTTFKVYFPRVIEESETEDARHTSEDLPHGTETILLVENEEMVRTLTRQILEMCGYTVLEARNGIKALILCEQQDCHIDLLMTDVVMPQMGGRELVQRLTPIYPQICVLFMSGYTDDAIVRHGVIEAGVNFIQKPFTPDALAHKVRGILGGLKEN
jgi:two-component system cell cycle sensor histidine kinase/response regulator CckA